MEPITEFNCNDLHSSLIKQINDAGFVKPTPIQALTLKPILSGKDIFAQAETGSGKTAAFVIPILEQILRDKNLREDSLEKIVYIVLCPTRELAQQSHSVFNTFGSNLKIKSCCIIGGESIEKQIEFISNGVQILIATPGRLTDLIKQKAVQLDSCKGVVFDEADRLFDMGFKKDIEFILSKTTKQRQLIMLSATSNQDVLRTAYKFNSQPIELKLNEDSLLVDHIDHKLAMVSKNEKFSLLVHLLREKENAYAIVFCNTQFQTHTVAEWLIKMGFKAQPISGRLAQSKRTKLMEDFRSKEITILVCTDVAARGLDIKNVNLVINYDLPQEAANYVHRIGRTGRAGEEGSAISFCAHEDCEFLDPIYNLIESKIEKLALKNNDFATDLCRKPFIDRKTLKVTNSNNRNDSNNNTNRNKSFSSSKQLPRSKDSLQRDIDYQKKTKDYHLKSGVGQENSSRVDHRFLEVTTYNIEESIESSLAHFRIDDCQMIGYEILESYSKKYFFFGPRKIKAKLFIKPIYKKLLLPFLIPIIKKSGLSLFAKVSYKSGRLQIHFSGKDEQQLIKNDFELLNSFEYLIKMYLQMRIVLGRNFRLEVRCFKKNDKPNDNHGTNRSADEAKLINLAKSLKKKVLSTNEEVKTKKLNPADRRMIHLFFEKENNLSTRSEGEGRFKQVIISIK